MATTYQSIFSMNQLTTIGPKDAFLLARGNQTYYSSYQCLYEDLSARCFDDFVNQAFELSVISNESELAESQTSKAVGGNIGYAFKTRIDGLNSSTVKLTTNQTIDGIKTFSSTPKCANAILANDTDVVNCYTLTSYVQSQISSSTPMFSTWFDSQRVNRTTFVSRLCPIFSSATFPQTFTIFAEFFTTGTSKRTPEFAVYNTTSGSDVAISTNLYAGTRDINASTSKSNTNKSYCKYKCVVSDVKGDKTKIVLDNKNSDVQVYLTIYRGNVPDPE